MRRHQRRLGSVLLQAVVVMFLLFVAAMVLFQLLQNSGQAYTRAAQVRAALRLANQGLEVARTNPVAGTTQLSPVDIRLSRSSTRFTPTLVLTTDGAVLLARSKVSWVDDNTTHQVELKTYVAP